MAKFYVTTPIYYINYVPTVGSAYTTIAADVLARWHRLLGYDVFFLTGLDENSTKTVKAAKEAGLKPKAYADKMAEKWKEVWKKLVISYDGFIRTSEKRHAEVVKKIFERIWKAGDIYKGIYEGLYCEGCEAFITESELVDGKCPLHKKEPKKISEENYFFRLKKYEDKLLEHIERNPDFIKPDSRRNEVVSFIKAGLKDVSISRPGLEWGIKLPIDEKHVFWVWFDALINYISGAPERYWPADLHLIGKDILRFHCIIWPAMLMSAKLPLPKQIFVHGFFTINGQKISKSLGNAIDPVYLANEYSVDALRYFVLREIPFGEDGDFSEDALKARLNGELVADLGNLLTRVLVIAQRYKGQIKGKDEVLQYLELEKIKTHMQNLEFHHALDEIWNFIRALNRYINAKEPWKLDGEQLGHILHNLLEGLRNIAILISPFMPEAAKRMCKQLGVKLGNIKDIGFKPWKGNITEGKFYLFKKIE